MNVFFIFLLEFVLISGLWIVIWLRDIDSINQIHSKEQQYIKDKLNLATTKKSELISEIRILKTKIKELELKVEIQNMEIKGDVEELTKIVTSKYVDKSSSKFLLAQAALHRLGYECIFHHEEFHMEERERWVTDDEDYDTDCEGDCNSMNDVGFCYNQTCVRSHGYLPPSPSLEKYTAKIIDKEAYIEVVKIRNIE